MNTFLSVLPGIFTIVVVVYMLVTLLPLTLFHWASNTVQRLKETGKPEEAYARARSILRRVSRFPVSLFFRPVPSWFLIQVSHLAEERGDIDTALEYAERASTTKPEVSFRLMAMQRSASLLRLTGRDHEAARLENEILVIPRQHTSTGSISLTDASLTTELSQFQILLNQGRFTRALALIDSCIPVASTPQHMTVVGLRAVALRYLGRYDQAIICLDLLHGTFAENEASMTAPRFEAQGSVVCSKIGKIYKNLYITEILSLVVLCLEVGRVGSAQEHWQKLYGKTTSPHIHSLYTAVNAWLCAALGNDDKARRLLQQVGTASDTLHTTRDYVVAQTHIALREYATAADIISRLIAHTNHALSKAEYNTLLGDCYQKMEHFEEAIAAYQEVIAAGFDEAAFHQHAKNQLSVKP